MIPSHRVRATWLESGSPKSETLYFEVVPRIGEQVKVPGKDEARTVIMVTHDAETTPATIHIALH